MQNSLPAISGQLEYLQRQIYQLKSLLSRAEKKRTSKKKTLYGSLPKVNLSFLEFKELRKSLSSAWENEWK